MIDVRLFLNKCKNCKGNSFFFINFGSNLQIFMYAQRLFSCPITSSNNDEGKCTNEFSKAILENTQDTECT